MTSTRRQRGLIGGNKINAGRRSEHLRLYARQFVAGPAAYRANSDWLIHEMGADLTIAHDRFLSLTTAENDDNMIVCLGHVVDPRRPDDSDFSALHDLLCRCNTFAEFEAEIHDLAGRYLMFVRLSDKMRLYPDAGGTKSAYYAWSDSDNAFWVGSQPRLVSDASGSQIDRALLREFTSSEHAHSWPAETTPYAHVHRLLPNHYLSYETRTARRFWPGESAIDLPDVDPDSAAEEIATSFRSQLQHLVGRAKVAMPLTGGHDSRTLMACTLEYASDIEFFVVYNPQTPYFDRLIPRRLSRLLGVNFQAIKAKPCDRSFWSVVKHNMADMAWDEGLCNVNTFGALFPGWSLVFTGMAEIGRCFYYPNGAHPSHIDARRLAQYGGYRDNPVAIRSFERWLSRLPRHDDLNTLDLFYWEHRVGNWHSLMYTALDTVCDPYTPFNCRRILLLMLAQPVELRQAPYRLFRHVCALADPRMIHIPFNDSWLDRLSHAVGSIVPWRLRHRLERIRMKWAGLE